MYGKARCPECGKVFIQWAGQPTDGGGSITFDKDGHVEFDDLLITHATLRCPNPECSFEIKDLSYIELEAWFKEHRVDDSERAEDEDE
ncbi:MAG: hypothetical protein ACP5L4_06745 [Thermoplasmata archaeon]